MNATCDDCGSGVILERVSVLVRAAGDYQILGPCCSFRHPIYKQYEPQNPRDAVNRVQRGVATDGGEPQ